MEPLTFLVMHYCKSALQLQEAGCVKTAVCHCDRKLGETTLMTRLLKCDNSAELKGQSCHSRRREKCSVVERSVGGCWSSKNSMPAVQVSQASLSFSLLTKKKVNLKVFMIYCNITHNHFSVQNI